MGAKLMIWGVGDVFGDGDVLAALCGSWFVEVSKGAGAGWVCKEQGCCVLTCHPPKRAWPNHRARLVWVPGGAIERLASGAFGWCRKMTDACSVCIS
jgi:hypothetical protein